MVFTLRPSAYLGSLATGRGLGIISCRSDIVRFVQGGVVNTFRCTPQVFEMSDHPIGFGDSVRVLQTAETEALGLTGLVGSVYCYTTPSVTGVHVVGGCPDDFAINVHFDELDVDHWFNPELLEFVDHGAGTEIMLDGVRKKWTRNADGGWNETDISDDTPPKRGFLARLFGW